MATVWPNVTVTDESLARCISDVRLALRDRGQRIIRTVPRRGYRLAVPTTESELREESDEARLAAAALAPPSPVPGTSHPLSVPQPRAEPAPAHPGHLPQLANRLIGRERDVAEIEALVSRHRLVTLVGTAGVGKTSLSVQVGANPLARFPDGARFVELAPLDRAELVGETVAAVFGLPVHGERPAADAVSIDAGHVRTARGHQGRTFEVMAAQFSNEEGKPVLFSGVPGEADQQDTKVARVSLEKMLKSPPHWGA